MVSSSMDNARPVGADYDRSRPRMVSAHSNATSPQAQYRALSPECGNNRRPTSVGRSFNGVRDPSPSYDESRRSPLRQASYHSPRQRGKERISRGSCRRSSTTQFAYPGHSTGLTDFVSEQFRDLSFDEYGGRDFARSVDFSGVFDSTKERMSPGGKRESGGGGGCGGGGNAAGGGRAAALRTAPASVDRVGSVETNQQDRVKRRPSAMLDPHWLRSQAKKDFSPNRVSSQSPRHMASGVQHKLSNALRSSLYVGNLQGDAEKVQACPSPAKVRAMRPDWNGPDRASVDVSSNIPSPPLEQDKKAEQSEERYMNYDRDILRRVRENTIGSGDGMEDIEASIAGLMKRCQFLEAENEFLREKEIDLRGDLCRSRAENAAISAELKRTHDLYREALGARRNAREALSEMAQQNARLVSAYVEKKQEFRSIQDSYDEERQQWQAQIENLESELTAARQVQAMQSPLFSDSDTFTAGTNSSDEEEMFAMPFAKLSSPKQENAKPGVSAGTGQKEAPKGGEIDARAFQEIQLENLRLQEENKKLKQHCEDADKERKQADIALRENQVEDLKQRGNDSFREKKWDQAVDLYTQAIGVGIENNKKNAVLYCNRACCFLKIDRLLEAVSDSYMSISLDSQYYKAYMRRSEALSLLGDHAGALQDLRTVVMAKSPESQEASERLKVVQSKMRSGHPLEAYKVLSVSEDASPAQVRVAYKRLALKYHPDKAECKETAAILFKMVAEANAILSDEEKKREHDMTKAVLRNRRSHRRG